MITELKVTDSNLSFDENFSIAFQHNTLPIENSLERLERGIICICTKGEAEIEIDFMKYHVEKGAIVTAFPIQVVGQKHSSNDFSLIYFACSKEMLHSILSRIPSEFNLLLKKKPVFKISEENYLSDIKFLKFIKNEYNDAGNIFRRKIVVSLLRAFYLKIYNRVYYLSLENVVKPTRRMEIMRMYIDLIMQYYKQSREVAFYANKLNITPKYLSIVTQEINGQGAKKIIDDFMVTEIKLQLKSRSKSIQEISERLNFPDQSFFCKYFKRHTGLTPSEYRNK